MRTEPLDKTLHNYQRKQDHLGILKNRFYAVHYRPNSTLDSPKTTSISIFESFANIPNETNKKEIDKHIFGSATAQAHPNPQPTYHPSTTAINVRNHNLWASCIYGSQWLPLAGLVLRWVSFHVTPIDNAWLDMIVFTYSHWTWLGKSMRGTKIQPKDSKQNG